MVRRQRAALAVVGATLLGLLGSDCGGGSGSGGNGATIRIDAAPIASPDARCAALSQAFPPGFSFVPGVPGLAVVASLGNTQTLVPFDIDGLPPQIASSPPILGIPLDSDGDGRREGVPGDPNAVATAPFLDDVLAIDADLGLATASSYEEVILFRPRTGTLLTATIEVPASVPERDYSFLPPPGTAEDRTAVSTRLCVRPPPGAVDSRGEPLETALRRFCDPSTPSFRTTFTSGAALAADRLFVSTSNLGVDRGTANTQYLPGTVLVYDFDRSGAKPRVSPNEDVPVIFTTGFNPTHVTRYETGGREFVLVSVTGALGIEQDDPGTPPVEGGGIPLTDSAIDVIDAQTLELVATIPLGPAALAFDPLAIDRTGRVALGGSVIQRAFYGVDLASLRRLPSSAATPEVLPRDEAVIFDAQAPFRIPGIRNGAPPESCPGQVFGISFDDAGRRVLATDFCDGTLALVASDFGGSPTTSELRGRFVLLDVEPLVAPLRPDTLGEPRTLSRIAVRPGRPGVDFTGPDVFFLVGQEEGQFCGLRLATR